MKTNELENCCQKVAIEWQQSRHGKMLHWIAPGGRALCGCKRSKHGWKPATVDARCPECEWRFNAVACRPEAVDILARMRSYFGNGGLFNPEMMEHEKVRDLLMDCQRMLTQ